MWTKQPVFSLPNYEIKTIDLIDLMQVFFDHFYNI